MNEPTMQTFHTLMFGIVSIKLAY